MEMQEEHMELLRTEARGRYQVMIDYIKAQVGDGSEYINDLVKVVLSERGCYYEFRDMPEEFSGAVGSNFTYEFVGFQQSVKLIEQVQHIIAENSEGNTRELAVLAVYGRDGLYNRDQAYVYHRNTDEEMEDIIPTVSGYLRTGTLPLFLKMKADSDIVVPVLGGYRGVMFFVANLTDQHLIVRIPHDTPGSADLGQTPLRTYVH